MDLDSFMLIQPPDTFADQTATSSLTRWRRKTFIGLLLIPGLWIASTGVVTWQLTQRKLARRPEPQLVIEGHSRTDLVLETSDGEQLGAWYFEGQPDQPVVLVMHGNNGSRYSSREIIRELVRAGCPVLAVTLRAHGDSSGSMNDIGWSARLDIESAVNWLEQHHPGRKIVVMGRSMSSAAALFAAKSLGTRVSAYWLEQPYDSLEQASWRRLQRQLPRGLDHAALFGMKMWSNLLLPVHVSQISPVDCVADIPESIPIVIITGDRDPLLPVEDVKRVYERVAGRARFVLFEAEGHIRLAEADPVLYRKELDRFLAQVRGEAVDSDSLPVSPMGER